MAGEAAPRTRPSRTLTVWPPPPWPCQRDREEAGWAGEVAWVGDSTLWHLEHRLPVDARHRPGRAQDSEADYHSTGVRPMPSAGRRRARRCEFRVGAGALFVMTDGVANPLTLEQRRAGTRWPNGGRGRRTRSRSRRRSASPASRTWTTGPS